VSSDGLTHLLAPASTFLIAAGSPGAATLAGVVLWSAVAAAGLGALMLHWAPAP
jgi:hypothetical protein